MTFVKTASFVGDPPESWHLGDTFQQSRLLTCIRLIGVQLIARSRYPSNVNQISAHVLVAERLCGFDVEFHYMNEDCGRIVIFNASEVSIALWILRGIERHDLSGYQEDRQCGRGVKGESRASPRHTGRHYA